MRSPKIYVEKTVRPKYACRCCEGTDDEDMRLIPNSAHFRWSILILANSSIVFLVISERCILWLERASDPAKIDPASRLIMIHQFG
ncbi:MAG: hypothetical protein FWC36_05600 [Spirochaetes bacterium]|nr:hypothetical protein [Spirochaetota bacterium]